MAEKRVGERTFRVQKMLASRGIVMQARLFRVIGGAAEKLPAILAAYGGDEATPESRASATAVMVQAVSDIFIKTEPEALMQLVADIIRTADIRETSGSYTPCDLDRDFSDEYDGELIPMVVWILQEQFSDFFSGVLANGGLSTLRKG